MKQPLAFHINAVVVLISTLWSTANAAPLLGNADTFAVLGGSTVTNTGPTSITGNLGVSPGTAITGFPPGTVVSGSTFTGGASLAGQAHNDAITAYNTLAAEPAGTNLTGQNLGGLTLTPGVYKFNSSAQLTGALFLNTQGDPSAVFHFQIGSTLTTSSSSAVVTLGLGGAVDKNIFWQIGSSATLGSKTAFDGTLLALTSITLNNGAGIRGRALAINGAVTLDSNNVSNAANAAPLPGAPTGPSSPVIVVTQGSFQSVPGLTPNENSVAAALDTLASHDPTSNLVGALDTVKLGQLSGYYDLLTPVEFAAIFDVGFALSQEQTSNIERRLEEIRDGSTLYGDGAPASDSHGSTNIDAKDGKHMIDLSGKDVSDATAAIDRRWGFFITGFGEWADVESTSNAAGSDFFTGGGTVGADYRLSKHVVIGLTAGYAHTSSDGVGDGRIDINNANANAYATWFDHGFYVNGIVGGGQSFYRTRRESVGGLASGDTEGTDFTGTIGAGYDHHVRGWTVGPIAAIQYTRVSLNGFTENGSLAPLHLGDQSQDSLESRIGARVFYAWRVGPLVVVTPEVRAQWQHEFQNSSRGISANFAEDSTTSFGVNGPEIGRDSLLLDVGVSVHLSPRTSIFAYYTGDFGAKNYTSHTITAGVRISF